jgi:hypothetical protein
MAWMTRPAEDRPFCLVTDGGYYENLGVEALLRRRCKLVIAMDAGHDERHQFEDFVRLVRRARLEHGIRLQSLDKKLEREMLDCISLGPDESAKKGSSAEKGPCPPPSWTRSHFTPVRIIYPDGAAGLLIYMKSSMTGDEPLEVIYYQKQNRAFPHDTTGDQFFDADQFLSYLQLGSHVVEKVVEKFEGLNLATASVAELEARFKTPAEAQPTAEETKAPAAASVANAAAPGPSGSEEELAAALSAPRLNDFDEDYWLRWITKSGLLNAIRKNDAKQVAYLLASRINLDVGYILPTIERSLTRTSELPPDERWIKLRQAIGRAVANRN